MSCTQMEIEEHILIQNYPRKASTNPISEPLAIHSLLQETSDPVALMPDTCAKSW